MSVKRRKIILIFSLSLSSILIYGINKQNLILVILGFFSLTYLVIRHSSNLSFIGIVSGMIVLYPLPQMGWLYGRDSHYAALGAQEILESGWPTNGLGFTETPLLHLHAALMSVILELPLYPSLRPKPLITQLLPIVYVSVSFIFIALMMKNVINTVPSVPWSICVLPVTFWIPFVKFHSGFRRESIAIVFFIILVYLIFTKKSSHKGGPLFIIIFVSILWSHHLTVVISLLFLTIALITHWKTRYQKEIITWFTIGTVLFLSWYIIGEIGGGFIIGVILSPTKGSFAISSLPTALDPPILTVYRSFFGLWLYQLVIAIPIIFSYLLYDGEIYDSYIKIALYFGGAIAVGSVAAFILNAPIAYTRLMSFFIVACGWISPIGVYIVFNKFCNISSHNATKVFIIILIMIGASLIPLHIISSAPPDHAEGEFDQRFDERTYPAAHFADQYMKEEEYVATLNLWGIIETATKTPMQTRVKFVSKGSIPPNSAIFWMDRNQELYITKYGSINPNNNQYSRSTYGRFYSNGFIDIFSDTDQ